MIIHFLDNIIIEKLNDNFISLCNKFPKEFIYSEDDDFDIGDKIIDNKIIRKKFFYAIDDNGFAKFLKDFDKPQNISYVELSKEDYYNYINSSSNYKINNNIIEEYVPPISKEEKFKQLEDFIYNKKDMGFLFKEKRFKCDDLASSRINKIVTGILAGASPFPLTWITRNSQEGAVVFNTKEEFMEFYNAMSTFELQVQVQEATLKMKIELANTQEELDNIVFE